MRSSLLNLSAFSMLLSLAACATTDDAAISFSTGSPEELAQAEELGLNYLFEEGNVAQLRNIDAVQVTRVRVDDLNMAHVRVQQLVNDVPVFGGEAIVHMDQDGVLSSITDDLVPDVKVDTTPAYSADEAIDLAAELYYDGWDVLTDEPTADLWVLRHNDVDHLAWRVQLHRADGSDVEAIPVVFVDAHTGEEIWSYDNMQRATCSGTSNFYGTVSFDCYSDGTYYYTEDTTDLLATYSWYNTTTSLYYMSATGTTFGTSTQEKSAVDAQYGLQASYNYYQTAHGRNGIDGAGGPGAFSSHGYNFITATTSYYTNYVNAYWDPSGLYLTFGDGDGYNANAMTTLDILGHEMTHGVTQYEANLTYSGESGGLNESMSDVFGSMIKRSVLGESTNTWLVGDATWTPSVSGDALRYMNDPAADGYSYDYYSSSVGSADVHYSSGVGNLAFYLLAQGGTHPRGKSTTSVTAIGADDAADIWYSALANYMTSSTTYSGARTATLSAAAALFGSTSAQYTSVGNAWTAVGVGGTSSSACTTTNYTSSVARKGYSYQPSSSGTSANSGNHTVSVTGTSGVSIYLYLQKKSTSGSTWSTVASSTGSGSSKSITYNGGTSGTYRTVVYGQSGSSNFNLAWCKP